MYDELPNFIKPDIALRSSMQHLVENELFREACGVMQPDASAAAKDLHTRFTQQLSRMLRFFSRLSCDLRLIRILRQIQSLWGG